MPNLGKKCTKEFEKFKEIYGYSSKDLMKNLKILKEEREKANQIFKEEITKTDSPIFKGIKKTIQKLSEKYTLVLISATIKEEVIQKLKKYGLEKEFDFVLASDGTGPMKKIPAIKETLEKTNSKPEETIMVGDRVIDYDQGTQAGLLGKNIIIVEYGWGYDKGKIPQQKNIQKPEDLLKAIEEIEKKLKNKFQN